jgi:hypothetical protein
MQPKRSAKTTIPAVMTTIQMMDIVTERR